MTDITLEDREAFCQLGSGFSVAYVRERPLRSKRKPLNRGGMEEERRPGSGDDTFAFISGQVYHHEAGVHALDKQLDSGTFFVLIE